MIYMHFPVSEGFEQIVTATGYVRNSEAPDSPARRSGNAIRRRRPIDLPAGPSPYDFTAPVGTDMRFAG
jgi:hypothetical protein